MSLQQLYTALLLTSIALLMAQLTVQRKRAVHLLFAVFCGSMAMLALKQISADSLGPYQFLLGFGACATCNGYWLVSRALFRREHAVTHKHIAIAATVALMIIASEAYKFSRGIQTTEWEAGASAYAVLGELLTLLSSTMLVLSAWEGIRGFNQCNREERLQRVLFLLSFGGALFACVIFAKHALAAELNLYPWLVAISALQILCVTQVLIIWRFHPILNPAKLATTTIPEALSLAMPPPPAEPLADASLATAIKHELIEQQLYLQPNLKVANLARQLNVPEYKISRTIRLHFHAQNFNQLVNSLRIKHAAELMADPSKQHWPALTIGLESGFASVGPFTRAFKAIHGCTPGEYRQSVIER